MLHSREKRDIVTHTATSSAREARATREPGGEARAWCAAERGRGRRDKGAADGRRDGAWQDEEKHHHVHCNDQGARQRSQDLHGAMVQSRVTPRTRERRFDRRARERRHGGGPDGGLGRVAKGSRRLRACALRSRRRAPPTGVRTSTGRFADPCGSSREGALTRAHLHPWHGLLAAFGRARRSGDPSPPSGARRGGAAACGRAVLDHLHARAT
jgi:hypothetical protein